MATVPDVTPTLKPCPFCGSQAEDMPPKLAAPLERTTR